MVQGVVAGGGLSGITPFYAFSKLVVTGCKAGLRGLVTTNSLSDVHFLSAAVRRLLGGMYPGGGGAGGGGLGTVSMSPRAGKKAGHGWQHASGELGQK